MHPSWTPIDQWQTPIDPRQTPIDPTQTHPTHETFRQSSSRPTKTIKVETLPTTLDARTTTVKNVKEFKTTTTMPYNSSLRALPRLCHLAWQSYYYPRIKAKFEEFHLWDKVKEFPFKQFFKRKPLNFWGALIHQLFMHKIKSEKPERYTFNLRRRGANSIGSSLRW
ncbi:hypothetical protein CsatB_014574 [Cannabis sativa]